MSNYLFSAEEMKHIKGNATMTGYNLIHGYCGVVANWMYGVLDSKQYPVKIERAYVDIGKPVTRTQPVAHRYCVVEKNGVKAYIDARGVSFDKDEFLKEFVEYETTKNGTKPKEWIFMPEEPNRYAASNAVESYSPFDPEYDAILLLEQMYKGERFYNHIWNGLTEWSRRVENVPEPVSNTYESSDTLEGEVEY